MKSQFKAFLAVCLVALITLWSGCATTFPYVGPDYSQPTVSDQSYTHWNSTNMRTPHWETHHVLVFENPLYQRVSFDVDCQYNYFAIDLAPRTVQKLLLVDQDGSCNVVRVPARYAPL